MVGDAEQLPPVGVGFVLKDVIKSSALPRVHLDEIFRQGEGSDITLAAHKIHSGQNPSYSEEFKFIERSSDVEIVETVVKLCRDLTFDEENFHVISPTHHGDAGVTNLNRELRTALNPNRGLASVKVGMDEIRVNDKVMVTQNHYDLGVYNGDIGRVDKISKDSLYLILNGTGLNTRVEIPTKEARLLRLAYATTVHKSQGQEYDTVIIPMTKRHGNLLLKRSLIYTAVTRAKKNVILIGDQEAIGRAIRNVEEYGEFSRLSERLKGEIL
jgi:exodeoxyribonuclease V alpha subunit